MPETQSPHRVDTDVGRALSSGRGPFLLAVSGGIDSMVLLHAALHSRAAKRRCIVATFDHGSGPHSSKAARLVRATARSLGVEVVTGRARAAGASEAEWRELRWRFLRSVAARYAATIVTAHTRDDQLETVVMRILRGASARGLAALYADSAILRPLLGVTRGDVERYASAHDIRYVEDPTNASRAFLRSRVRHDLLPAIRAVRPTFEKEILALSKQAAQVRRTSERLARAFFDDGVGGQVEINSARLADLTPDSVALLWPVFVAPLGVPLDRRGVERATTFSLTARAGQQAHCGGAVHLERTAEQILVRRGEPKTPATVELGSTVEFGVWRLRRVSKSTFTSHVAKTGSSWAAAVEHPEQLIVRAWQPGDRVKVGPSATRRVKRYFSERSIPLSERKTWPVVVGNGEIVWVPGVCGVRSESERPGHHLTYMICERRAG